MFSIIIIDVIVNVFYQSTYNTRLAFNPVIPKFFTLFGFEILAFLFGIIYYKINKYQDSIKIVIFFNKKIVFNIYFNIN